MRPGLYLLHKWTISSPQDPFAEVQTGICFRENPRSLAVSASKLGLPVRVRLAEYGLQLRVRRQL
jgi:hypothetical protein